MRRRNLQLILVLLMGIFLACGCKKSVGTPEDNAVTDTKESEDDDDGGGKEQFKFGFSAIDMANPFFITLEHSLESVIKEEGGELITKDPGSDAALQNEQIQEMIESGIDAIFICPVNWIEITESLKALKEAGVRIINVDTEVKEMDYVDAYIGSDNLEAGRMCGRDLINRCPDGGKIFILECPTQNSMNSRITGFEETITEAKVGFEIVGRADTNGEFQKALEITGDMIENNAEIDIIMCGNDQTAVGAVTAANLANRKDIIIYSVDGSPDIKKELVKPNTVIAGTVAQSPIEMGETAAKTGLAILRGEDYEKTTYTKVFMIDQDNVELYGTDGWQ